MRVFIAVEIPEETKKKAMEIQGLFGNIIKASYPSDFHLTLKFLGDVSGGKLEEVKKIVGNFSYSGFDLHLAGMGAFPSDTYIRVLWIGAKEGGEDFVEMQRSLDYRLNSLGFRLERDYVPHLTLARVRAVYDKRKLLELMRRDFDLGMIKVDAVHIIKSELSPKGPRYTILYTKKL